MPRRSVVQMGTIVTVDVVGAIGDDAECGERMTRALAWFEVVERACSRFDPASELRQLGAVPGTAVAVGPILFEAVQFAIAVAHESGGAFDPTIGAAMDVRGFDRDDRSGDRTGSGVADLPTVSYRDVEIDCHARTITLRAPLVLDLGAVAKGLAIDMAARELAPLRHFMIDAGGDLYAGGCNARGKPWSIGIRHPRRDGEWIETVTASDCAVCTSGDYERASANGHHLIDPVTREPAAALASATVIAPTAMVADALATAAFVLGPEEGLRLLERQRVEGLLLTAELDRHATRGFGRV